MAASPSVVDDIRTRDRWGAVDDQDIDDMGPVKLDHDTVMDDLPTAIAAEDPSALANSHSEEMATSNLKPRDDTSRDRPPKPNKVYIGGLPENTRPEDLRNGFGKLGNIINIELKTGYGFVEFDNRRSAEESVAKYHEGYFMGNKVRVEMAHGKGRATKRIEDPGACFKCGENGHWAKECSRQSSHSRSGAVTESTLLDRLHPRDYATSRDYSAHRDDTGRYASRESRYYDSSPPPSRDYRRLPSPPKDQRDYPMPPPRSSRDYDEYRTRGPPSSRYDRSGYERDSFSSRNPPAPPRDYDRYDRRPVDDRYEPPVSGRPRTPPGPPPSRRDYYDRPPRYEQPERVERGRPITPPPRSRSLETARYRRRSLSPRSSRYEPVSYSNSSNYSGNGYASDRHSASLRDSGRSRDYYRNGRESENSYRPV
ncbi:hypothetical protein PISMIDRAFT_8819 [Pisolithus microcarpus 441]|uniref:RNA-binding domain-containing protein n=1 Tax=Pisolithus microcarpus 441 TaxID=765257 RepID=A0A0C9Z0M6_9AGAM|nr:hypothetical protein PISMIDRAFT_282712 [Pisolithus microcarpus 441]KIK26433.1 hypothetical protein PISMIDRAFT_8819 [Pisolithus microcarpus 441]